MWKTPLLVGAFVTPERLGPVRWQGQSSEPIIVETIPRITSQLYYRDIYARYTKDFDGLPFIILGNSDRHGGDLNDPRIVGRLDDDAYYRRISAARISI